MVQRRQFRQTQPAGIEEFGHGPIAAGGESLLGLHRTIDQLHGLVHRQRLGQTAGPLGRPHSLHGVGQDPPILGQRIEETTPCRQPPGQRGRREPVTRRGRHPAPDVSLLHGCPVGAFPHAHHESRQIAPIGIQRMRRVAALGLQPPQPGVDVGADVQADSFGGSARDSEAPAMSASCSSTTVPIPAWKRLGS